MAGLLAAVTVALSAGVPVALVAAVILTIGVIRLWSLMRDKWRDLMTRHAKFLRWKVAVPSMAGGAVMLIVIARGASVGVGLAVGVLLALLIAAFTPR